MNFSDVNLRQMDQSPMLRSTEGKDGVRFDSDFSKIEELIKGNTFTREEIGHLMEILNSRVETECEKQKSSSNAGVDTQLVSWTHEIQRTPSQEKQQDIDRTMIDTFCEKSDIPVGVSASPIDIARAYMAGRTSEGGHDLYNFTSKSERAQPSNEFARQTLLPPPSPKPSICWPGAMVHERHGYTTPQSQRARHRLHGFPRTPYSRTTLSKSTTNLQADSGYANTSTPFQQSQASIYGQVKSRGDTIDRYGSVGPIRRIRNKFASEIRPRESILLSSRKESPSITATSKVFGGFLPGTEKNVEPGETSGASKYLSGENVSGSSDRDISDSNLSSSQAVRKILEHLDRNKPTPKEKEAEMKLATAWRRSPEATDTIHEEIISSMHEEDHASHKNTDIAGPSFSVGFNRSSSKLNSVVNFHDKSINEAKDTVNENAKLSTSVFTGSSIIPGANPVPSFGFKATSGPLVKNLNENAFATTSHGQTQTNFHFSHPHLSNGQDMKLTAGTTVPEFAKNHGTNNKPSLPSISINKRDFRGVSSSDNRPGFTFPVSASAGSVLSEPPTPSIMPSSSGSILSQPMGVPAIPSYTFGTNKSTPSLVFSFPSTSNASTREDSDLKFSFGSDKKTRLSFSSIGKDAICY